VGCTEGREDEEYCAGAVYCEVVVEGVVKVVGFMVGMDEVIKDETEARFLLIDFGVSG
jgi:hypothetical protein